MIKTPVFKKDQTFDLKIERLTPQADGIGYFSGIRSEKSGLNAPRFAFFVKGALPGETVTARVIKLYKSYGIGRLERVVIPSPDRTAPLCPVFNRCGGCALSHLDYSAQFEYKVKSVTDTLRVIGHIPEDVIKGAEDKFLSAASPLRYRNKAQMPAAVSPAGEPCFGFFAPHSHTVIPVKDCLLCQEENKEIAERVIRYIKENNVSVYDESRHDGIVRHLIIRSSASGGGVMVCLCINSKRLPAAEKLIGSLTAPPDCGGKRVSGILININTDKTNVILGGNTVCLWGEPFITDILGGFDFRVSLNSFFQINPVQTEILYKKAVEYAGAGSGAALDIYCGIGTLTMFLAKKFNRVYGIEAVPEAVRDAQINAERNGALNAEFICSNAGDAVYELTGRGIKPSCVVLDPPRKGCDKKLLKAVCEMKPERIVYISCNPATLARDLDEIFSSGAGFELEKLSVFDCFPQTAHVESAALISRRV